MQLYRRWIVALGFVLFSQSAHADVVVIANRTTQEASFRVSSVDGVTRPQERTVLPLDLATVPCRGPVNIEFSDSNGRDMGYQLDPNCAYFFYATAERIDLQKVGLGETPATLGGRNLLNSKPLDALVELPVKICVDEEQPWARARWESRLKNRLAAASRILEELFHVRLKVVDVGTWDSDDASESFDDLLAEFQREVSLGTARIAIGFSSQYQEPNGRTNLGGVRGPMNSHMLVREWRREMAETERLELLVHELGHYLGAAHSVEPESVMRPILADKQARFRAFQIRFDPVNALVCYLVAEELRLRGIPSISSATLGTKMRLREIYAALARSQPSDPAAGHYERVLRKQILQFHVSDSTIYPLDEMLKTSETLPQINVSTVDQLLTALTSAAQNSQIVIAPGEYVLSRPMPVAKANLTIRGATGNRNDVVLRGSGMSEKQVGVAFAIEASNVTIADLTICNVGLHGIQVRGERGVKNVTIENVRIFDTGQQLLKGSTGDSQVFSEDCVVRKSLFEYSDHAPSDYTNGVDVLGGKGWVVEDNVFRNIRGPETGKWKCGPAVLFWMGSRTTVVERNTFINCHRGICLGLTNVAPQGRGTTESATYLDHIGGTIRNNLVWNENEWADEGIELNACEGATIENNTVITKGELPWSISVRFRGTTADVRKNLCNKQLQLRDGGQAKFDGNVVKNDLRAPQSPTSRFRDFETMAIEQQAGAQGFVFGEE